MEHIREFKITIYMDTNKCTEERVFDWEDYEGIDDTCEAAKKFLGFIQKIGALEVAWQEE